MHIINKGQCRVGDVSYIAGVQLTFTRHADKSGNPVLACEIPPALEGDALRRLQLAAGAHPQFTLVPEGLEVPPPDVGPAPTGLTSETASSGPRDMAILKGWSDSDLEGTNHQGDAGESGGRSPVTGLTCAEMALTRPPADWADKQDSTYPWLLGDWTSPTPGWTPPNPPAKTPPASSEGNDAGAGAGAESPPETPSTDASGETETETEGTGNDGETPAVAGDPASDDDPAVVAGYPAEHVAAARAITTAAAEKKGGQAPHPNAVNFLLKKQNLPAVNAKQVEGLLAGT